MSRLVIPVGAALLLLAFVVAALRSDEGPYRVAVEFDTAKGMVPGQLVKIAGARVGEVEDVRLTPRRKARMVLALDGAHGPFRSDARCRILPEGLISENYVECDPGSEGATALAAEANGLPTLPVERTGKPVSLQDILNTFDLPYSKRVSVLLSDLGIGLSGRGEDLNELLRRANPTLGEARDVLATIAEQRRAVRAAISQTDQVLAEVATRRADVRRLMENAAAALEETGTERRSLGEAIGRLPALLQATRSGMRELDRTARAAQPLTRDLRSAAPQLNTFVTQLPGFARAGRSAVRALSSAAASTRTALPPLRRVLADVDDLSRTSVPTMDLAGKTATNLRDRGAWEELGKFFYGLAASTSLYDDVSHYFSLFVGIAPQCFLPQHQTPVPGCDHSFSGPQQGQVPLNDPDHRDDQAAAVARSLRATPNRRAKSPLEAAARQLFLSERATGPDGRPRADRIGELLKELGG